MLKYPKLYQMELRYTFPVQNTALLRIDGVTTLKETDFYTGKKCCYVYKAKRSVHRNTSCQPS